MKKQTVNKNQLLVENWNLKNKIGTSVYYQKIKGGEKHESCTASAAFLSSSGEPVIMLEGVAGYYALSHVSIKE
jgi:hypothetical protein